MFYLDGVKMNKKEKEYDVVNKDTIKAVSDSDLVALLESLGVLSDIENGLCECIVCGRVVETQTLGAIVPVGNEIKFCCSDGTCTAKM